MPQKLCNPMRMGEAVATQADRQHQGKVWKQTGRQRAGHHLGAVLVAVNEARHWEAALQDGRGILLGRLIMQQQCHTLTQQVQQTAIGTRGPL